MIVLDIYDTTACERERNRKKKKKQSRVRNEKEVFSFYRREYGGIFGSSFSAGKKEIKSGKDESI